MSLDQHDALKQQVLAQGYIADGDLISSLHLMGVLQKPLLIEGEAGVGKTEIAKCLAAVHGAPLIRLQCYEGLDAHHALYDWDYQRQLMAIQMAGAENSGDALREHIYGEQFLLKRPLLEAISSETPAVLLIDEVDRADEEFEALLLEVLSDFQISIPELGTVTARSRPTVILTSNGIRELSDALRRRCLYHYVEYPDRDKELRIVRSRLPGINEQLAGEVVSFVQQLRVQVLRKTPGIAETLDWAESLASLGLVNLTSDPELVESTLTCLIKTRDDLQMIRDRDETNIEALSDGDAA